MNVTQILAVLAMVLVILLTVCALLLDDPDLQQRILVGVAVASAGSALGLIVLSAALAP